MATTLNPQQRALNFGAFTRQHAQTLGALTGTANSHLEFEVPRVRLIQSINLLVEVELEKGETADNMTVMESMEFYNVIRRFAINYNNGFIPIVGDGKSLAVMNMIRLNPEVIIPTVKDLKEKSMFTIENATYSRGSDDFVIEEGNIKYYFRLEIPLTLNDRDPVGLVLAQNKQTLINFNIDIADKVSMKSISQHYPVKSVKITPEIVSFSVPEDANAFPDISVIKTVDSRSEAFNEGNNILRLGTGKIYRKIILYFEDENGVPFTDEDITSNIDFMFNTADTPYSFNPKMLRLRNVSQLGYGLPEGYYALDLSNAGIPNLGGSRDYIDTELLTQFEVAFTANKKGKITVISEQLSRLRAQ